MVRQLAISSGAEVPAEFGPVRVARKRRTVRIREPRGPVERFHLSCGDLEAIRGLDYVICTKDKPEGEYPCKIRLFNASYEETSPGSGEYRRTAPNRLVPIPEGFEVTLKTREGDEIARSGAWIAIGVDNEVYALSQEFVEAELELAAGEEADARAGQS